MNNAAKAKKDEQDILKEAAEVATEFKNAQNTAKSDMEALISVGIPKETAERLSGYSSKVKV